jgi:transcriptional regulator NrdR family protein
MDPQPPPPIDQSATRDSDQAREATVARRSKCPLCERISHTLDRKQISSDMLFVENQMKHLHLSAEKPHNRIEQRQIVDQQQVSNNVRFVENQLKSLRIHSTVLNQELY